MEGRDSFDGSLANSSGCDSDSSSLTIRTTQDSNVDSPVQFRRIPSTPGMSVNRIVPEVGKCMANMTDDEFETYAILIPPFMPRLTSIESILMIVAAR